METQNNDAMPTEMQDLLEHEVICSRVSSKNTVMRDGIIRHAIIISFLSLDQPLVLISKPYDPALVGSEANRIFNTSPLVAIELVKAIGNYREYLLQTESGSIYRLQVKNWQKAFVAAGYDAERS